MLTSSIFAASGQVILVTSAAPQGATWLNIDDENLTVNFEAAGGSHQVPVVTNINYSAAAGMAWCTVSDILRDGFVINTSKNDGAGARSTLVSIIAKDNNSKTITVNQLGASPAILSRESVITIDNDTPEFTVEITSNVNVTITTPAWIKGDKEIGAGKTTCRFTADKLQAEAPSARTGEILFADKNGKTESLKVTVEQSFSGYPRFAVISDTHFGNNWDEGPMVKVPKALRNIISKTPRVDAIFICGDLTDWGNPSQYEQFRSVMENTDIVPADLPVYVMMGNHDNYADNALQNYLVLNQPYHQLIDIKGYPFITTSMDGGGWDDYAPEEIEALAENLKTASKKYPGKPIFVFTHVPPMNTVYGTCEGEGGWGSNVLTSTLSQYPQVVLFGGHSHFPLADPRSIHQGIFTTINDGSTTYAEIEPGVVNEGIHPYKAGFVTEGCIVNVDKDMNVEVERWDTYRDEEILPRWNISAPHDGSRFVYTNSRTGGSAPVWKQSDKVTVSDIANEGCTVTFPQATDDENVHHYVVELTDGDEVVATHSIFSGYYLNSDIPAELSVNMKGIPDGRTLKARVKALDSYKNVSEYLVSEPFSTEEYQPAEGTSRPKADLFDIKFSANGNAADVSGRGVEVKTGSRTPETYLNETYNLWTASFPGSGSSFYRVDYADDSAIKNAFSEGFTMELLYKPESTGNMCPLSAQEGGGAGIEQASGGQIQFYCHVGGGYKVLGSSVTAEAGNYYHVVAVYDKDAAMTRIYVNGAPAGEMAASGSFGFPSDVKAHWIGIGGDANPSGNAQFSLEGEIGVARMYSKAVSRDEVYWMYKDIKDRKDNFVPDPDEEAPVAALLDIQFNEGGEAVDISAHKSTISKGSVAPTTVMDETYGIRSGSFTGSGNCYYRVDYADDAAIRSAFENGFAFEVMYTCNSLGTTNVLSSQESGGAGFEQSSSDELEFWCHVGGSYKTIRSGIKAEVGKYYHLVASYDKESARIKMYVNGAPAGEITAEGDFRFPVSAAQWIGIGADARTETSGQNGLDGRILVARMYDKPLTRTDAAILYSKLKPAE